MSADAILKTLSEGLKYLELTSLFGQKLMVQSPSTVEADVQAALRSLCPYIGELRDNNPFGMRVVWAKYGFLDLVFHADAPMPAADSVSDYFVENIITGETDDDLSIALESPSRGMVSWLLKDVSKNAWYVKLYLDDVARISMRLEDQIGIYRKTEPAFEIEPYFPREFEVRDACLSNSTWVWSSKYFYL